MSRLSFRPRPLDIHKKLPIVKSVKDLDSEEGASVSRSALDAGIELVLPTPAKKGGGSEIPTPQFLVVDTYERDYTRTFAQPPSYIRGRGARSESAEFCEYDLDNEDEDWLMQVNNERKILQAEKFESMLFKLEILDHKARERQAALVAMVGMPMPVVLSKEYVLEALKIHSNRPAVLGAVYDYWKAKRDRWGKPVLRRLQPPPPVNDTNPFNVFRPREKVHRPHTRRMQRRENDVQSFEKLRQVRRILDQTRGIMRAMQQREEKKRDLVECEANMQRMQLRLKDEWDRKYVQHDAVRPEDDHGGFTPNRFMRADEAGNRSFGMGKGDHVNGSGRLFPTFELTPPVPDGATMAEQMEFRNRRRRKRFHHTRNRPRKRMKSMESIEPTFLFTKPLDPEKLAAAGIACMDNGTVAPPFCFPGRIGRGGRIVFDRWNPLTRTPLDSPSNNHFSSLSFAPPVDRFRVARPPRLSVVDPLVLNDTLSSAMLCGPSPPSTSAAPF